MARRKPVKKNPIGDSERFYADASKIGKKGGGGRLTPLKLRKDKDRRGTLSTVSKYPDLLDIYAMIDSVTKAQIIQYSKAVAYDVLSRDLLYAFAEDWGEINRDHAGYLSQVPDDYDPFSAALIGDLLYWMITGANERSKLKSGPEIRDAEPWPDEVRRECPNFSKRMDSIPGLTIHDLRGLQIRILNNLPINSYNRYTIAQVTQDDAELAEQFYPAVDPLSPGEHETLTTLKSLVSEGDILKFSVALAQSSSDLLDASPSGDMTFEAFEMAKQAVESYTRGEVEQSRMRLDALKLEYGMNLNSFQSGLKDMFVLTASAIDLEPTGGGDNQRLNKVLKGSPAPLLVSLDTSMPPTRRGWERGDMHSAMKAANQTNIEYRDSSSRAQIRVASSATKHGTLGLTSIGLKSGPILTTNWTGIFDAAITGRNLNNEDEVKALKSWTNIDWSDSDGKVPSSVSLRFIIHANLSEGIGDDYLVPKGLLTVTARPSKGAETSDAGGFALRMIKDSGKSLIFTPQIDLFVQDLGRAHGIADAFTYGSMDAELAAEGEEPDQTLAESMEEGLNISTARGRVKKGATGARGKAIAIDLVPKPQINVRSITEKHPNLKYLKRLKDALDLKDLYKHYATGQLPTRIGGGKYKWRGKIYNSKAQKSAAVGKTGTQVDKGHPKMQLLYARRKDNGNLVPHRLIIPRIMVRHDIPTGRLVANKGSKHSKATARLLKQLQSDFGSIKFEKDLKDVGGYDVVKGKDHRGRNKTRNYNRGVSKIFTSRGLASGIGDAEGVPLYVSQVALNGSLYYEGRMPGGRRLGPYHRGPSEYRGKKGVPI